MQGRAVKGQMSMFTLLKKLLQTEMTDIPSLGFFITPCLALASDVQQLMLTMIACLQDSFVALEIVLSNSSIGSD